MEIFISIPDKEIIKNVKSISADLFGMKFNQKDIETVKNIIRKMVAKRVNDDLYDIIKNSLDKYFNEM